MPGAALFGHDHLRLFIPNTGELVSLQYLSLCSFYFYFFGRGVSSLYRTHNTKVKLLVSICSFSKIFWGRGYRPICTVRTILKSSC